VEWIDEMAEEHILIIDDSTELRSLLESILPFSGYHTLSASTGEEGLELATTLRPDVILVDLELPDTTGLKVIEELNRRGLTIPTIMITGYGSEGTAARALRLGAQGYLVKPFTTEEVLSNVEKALVVRRLNREKAQLKAQLDTHARHFRALSAIGRALIDEIDLSQLYQRIVDAGVFVTRAERCTLALLDPVSEQLEVAATRGKLDPVSMTASPQEGAAGLRPVLEQGICVRLQAATGETIALQTGDEVKAVLQVPLKTQLQTIGLLSADRQDSPSPFGEHDEQMLAILASCVVIALKIRGQAEIAASSTQNADDASSGMSAS
jgi:two-component system NtrC family sensor kinase